MYSHMQDVRSEIARKANANLSPRPSEEPSPKHDSSLPGHLCHQTDCSFTGTPRLHAARWWSSSFRSARSPPKGGSAQQFGLTISEIPRRRTHAPGSLFQRSDDTGATSSKLTHNRRQRARVPGLIHARVIHPLL